MSSHFYAKRFFGFASCASVAGAILTLSPAALADCPDPDPATIAYEAPPTAACTDADIAALKTEWDSDAHESLDDVATAFKAGHAACAACVFTLESDPAWGVLVRDTDDTYFYNYGACYERATGGSAACGEAVWKFDDCVGARCSACEDNTSGTACFNEVKSDPTSCGQYDYMAACPNLGPLDDFCYDPDDAGLMEIVKTVCGVAAPDAGTSSSGGSSSGSNDSNDDDDEVDDDVSSSSSSGGTAKKKKSSSSGDSNEAAPSEVSEVSSGCAQSPGSGGSIASALVVGAAIVAAASRRRRDAR